MFKDKSVLEIARGEKRFKLEFDVPTTLVELIDVLCEMRASCLKTLQGAIDAQDEQTKTQTEKFQSEDPVEVKEVKEGE